MLNRAPAYILKLLWSREELSGKCRRHLESRRNPGTGATTTWALGAGSWREGCIRSSRDLPHVIRGRSLQGFIIPMALPYRCVYLFLSCQKPKKRSPFRCLKGAWMGPTHLLGQATEVIGHWPAYGLANLGSSLISWAGRWKWVRSRAI